MSDRQTGGWTAGEMLSQAEGSIGGVINTAVNNYYHGRDLDTAQAIRSARSDSDAMSMVTAMRRGRWQDLLMIAGVCGVGVTMGSLLQNLLGDPRIYKMSPVAALGAVSVAAGLAAPVGIPGRAALVAGGVTYAMAAQLTGWRGIQQ